MKSGVLVVNKQSGPTSHDIIDMVRRITGEQRVGHSGTLDPLASGVLVVGIGREATRLLGYLTKNTEKQYRARICFGAISTTDDAAGAITERDEVVPPKRAQLVHALQAFNGSISQRPPAFSSIKVGGRRAYERARAGEAVVLAPRTVTIHSIALRSYRWPVADIEVRCSAGTYIRALARDVGEALGVGAYLASLERTAVGMYTLQHAVTPAELERRGVEPFLLPLPQLEHGLDRQNGLG